MRYISNTFGEKLLASGTILDKISSQCDDGFAEMFVIEWTNGVQFIVIRVDGSIVKVHGV